MSRNQKIMSDSDENHVVQKDESTTKKIDSEVEQDRDFHEYHEYIEEKYRYAKAKVAVLENRMKSKYFLGFTIVISIMTAGVMLFTFVYNSTYFFSDLRPIAIMSVISAFVIWGFFFFYFKLVMEMRISRYKSIIVEYETNHIQENMEEDIFENLIKISYKYLDQYYLQVREQAQKSFIFTAIIAGIGAFLIFTGIVLMFAEKVNVSYISAGAGVITEFISSIFFYLYNKTVTSMSNYHNKLVLSQNISLALKVADSLPKEEQTKVKDGIVKELLKNINSYLITSENDKKL